MLFTAYPSISPKAQFQEASTNQGAAAFYEAFIENLASIQSSFEQNFSGVQARHWVEGNKTGFELIALNDPTSPAICNEVFHFHPVREKISCVRGGLSWSAAEQPQCLALVQAMIMRDLYHFDQRRVRVGMLKAGHPQ